MGNNKLARTKIILITDAWEPQVSGVVTTYKNIIGNLPEGIAAMDWPTLQSAVATCKGCGLCQGRQQAILGEGFPTADWMVVGDAPGEDEDKEGISFAGPAGQLLDNMLKALGLSRDQVY